MKKKRGRPPGLRTLPILTHESSNADVLVISQTEAFEVAQERAPPVQEESRKRSLSVTADEQSMPPPQRRRTEEPVPDVQALDPTPISTAVTVPPTPLSATAPVSSTESPLTISPLDVEMDIASIPEPTSPRPPPPTKPVLTPLLIAGKEEGEVSPAATPPALPTPREDGEIDSLIELRQATSLESREVTHVHSLQPSPKQTEGGGSMAIGPQPQDEQMAGPTPESPPRRLSLAPPPLERFPLSRSSTNISQRSDPVYGPSLEIMGIAWGSNKPTTSILDVALRQGQVEQLARWIDREKLDG